MRPLCRDLVKQAAGEHLLGACGDPRAALIGSGIQRDAQRAIARATGSLGGVLGEPLRLGLAALGIDLKRSLDAHRIRRVDAACRLRIDLGQPGVQHGPAMCCGFGAQARTQRGIGSRSGKQPLAQRSQIQARPTAQHGRAVPARKSGQRSVGKRYILRGTRRRACGQGADQVMRHARLLVVGWLGRQDRQTGADLQGIAAHDLATQRFGDAQRKLGLATRRRAHHDDKPRFRLQARAECLARQGMDVAAIEHACAGSCVQQLGAARLGQRPPNS